jgi:hypothetical protein
MNRNWKNGKIAEKVAIRVKRIISEDGDGQKNRLPYSKLNEGR